MEDNRKSEILGISPEEKKILLTGAALLVAVAGAFLIYGSVMVALASPIAFIFIALLFVLLPSLPIYKLLRWGWRDASNKRLWIIAIIATPAVTVIMALLLSFSPAFEKFMTDL